MKAKQLIALLKKLPPEAAIRMSRDPEGNGIYDIDSLDRWEMMVGHHMYVLCPDERKDYVEEDDEFFRALPEEERKALLAKAGAKLGLKE